MSRYDLILVQDDICFAPIASGDLPAYPVWHAT
jgi:hypothetical protein